MLDVIARRRSIRKYTAEDVSDDELNQLLQAAMAGPSGRALDPWEFIVVRDIEMRRQLSRVHQYSGMLANAPAVIVVCGDEKLSDHWIADCAIAAENILLQATSQQLGGVWVAIYPRPEREVQVRQLLNVPPRFRIMCMIPIGHPAEQKPPQTRFVDTKVHRERW